MMIVIFIFRHSDIPEFNDYYFVQIPLGLAIYIIWWVFIWNGTKYEKFFSKVRVCTFILIVISYLAVCGYNMYM